MTDQNEIQNDNGGRKYFGAIPHMAGAKMDVYEHRLYCHYVEVCGRSKADKCFQAERTLYTACGMSKQRFLKARQGLIDKKFITFRPGTPNKKGQKGYSALTTIIDIWEENIIFCKTRPNTGQILPVEGVNNYPLKGSDITPSKKYKKLEEEKSLSTSKTNVDTAPDFKIIPGLIFSCHKCNADIFCGNGYILDDLIYCKDCSVKIRHSSKMQATIKECVHCKATSVLCELMDDGKVALCSECGQNAYGSKTGPNWYTCACGKFVDGHCKECDVEDMPGTNAVIVPRELSAIEASDILHGIKSSGPEQLTAGQAEVLQVMADGWVIGDKPLPRSVRGALQHMGYCDGRMIITDTGRVALKAYQDKQAEQSTQCIICSSITGDRWFPADRNIDQHVIICDDCEDWLLACCPGYPPVSNTEHVGALCEVAPGDEIKVPPEQRTVKAKKPRTKKPPSDHTLMKNALLAAMGYSKDDITCWGDWNQASKVLRKAGATPDDIPDLYRLTLLESVQGAWKFNSPMALATRWPEYKKQQRKAQVVLDEPESGPADPSAGVVTYEGKSL